MTTTQSALLCGCGAPLQNTGAVDTSGAALCTKCARRARLNRERFGGLREARLREDESRCVVCGSPDEERLVVHHRKPGRNALQWLATLCRGCHLQVHLTPRPSFVLATEKPALYQLWREINRRQPEQLLLLESGSPAPGEQLRLV